jgi:hypothetical protein
MVTGNVEPEIQMLQSNLRAFCLCCVSYLLLMYLKY